MGDETIFYLDGALVDRHPKQILRHETLRGRLIHGDAPAGQQGWKGKLFGLAIHNRCLAPAEIARNCALWQRRSFLELENDKGLGALYFFNDPGARTIQHHSPAHNALDLPAIYSILRKTVFVPQSEDSSHIHDIAINILGFIPFGFFCFLYRRSTGSSSTTMSFFRTVSRRNPQHCDRADSSLSAHPLFPGSRHRLQHQWRCPWHSPRRPAIKVKLPLTRICFENNSWCLGVFES